MTKQQAADKLKAKVYGLEKLYTATSDNLAYELDKLVATEIAAYKYAINLIERIDF